jgi:AcrR family transcriptional regulator
VGRPRASVRKAYDADALADIAMRVFADRGYDGSTLDDIAAAAGIAKSSIYHHVAGKEDLLARGLGRGFRGLFEILEAEEATQGRAIDCFRFVLKNAIDGLFADTAGVRVLQTLRGMTPTEQWARARRREFNRRIAALAGRAISEGDMRADLDPELVTQLVYGMLTSIIEWYVEGDETRADAIADALLAIAFGGIEKA